MSLDYFRDRLREGLDGCKSIDCYLVRISSLVYELEDLSRISDNPREYVTGFLRDILAGLHDYLQPLACNIAGTMGLIDGDPRFKIIRKYRGEFLDILNNIKCVNPASLPLKIERPPPGYSEPPPSPPYVSYVDTMPEVKPRGSIGRRIGSILSRWPGFIIYMVLVFAIATNTETLGITSDNLWLPALLIGIIGIYYGFKPALWIDNKLSTSDLGIWLRRIISIILTIISGILLIMFGGTILFAPILIGNIEKTLGAIILYSAPTGIALGLFLGSLYLDFRFMRESGTIIYVR